ncbi:MAG: glycosyltransferase [Cryomorphaceae bacterium]|nr:glycosyltransferase [Flavobacteriales bacterium]
MTIADIRFFHGVGFGILALYALLLTALLIAVIRHSRRRYKAVSVEEKFTIVVPMKNEAPIIRQIIARYKGTSLDVLFVNDHSSDLSKQELDSIFTGANLPLLHLPDHLSGKKAAIHYAAERVAHPWILTSDADTALSPHFLQNLSGILSPDKKAYVLPVRPVFSPSALRAFLDLEFIILQAVGCGAAALGFPLLANGAAFLFRKEAYFESMQNRTDLHIPSGDDVFTLHAIAAAFGGESVGVILSEGPAANAGFPERAGALWNQRLRWIGKAGAVKGGVYRAVVWLVFLANALFIASLIDGAVRGDFRFFMGAALVKIAGEIFLTAWGVSYFRRADCLRWVLPGVFLYPFYFFALLITAAFYQPRWKQPASEPVD